MASNRTKCQRKMSSMLSSGSPTTISGSVTFLIEATRLGRIVDARHPVAQNTKNQLPQLAVPAPSTSEKLSTRRLSGSQSLLSGPSSYLQKALTEPTTSEVASHVLRGIVDLGLRFANAAHLSWVHAALSCGDLSDPLASEFARQRADGLAALRDRFQRGLEEGDLPEGTDAAALAHYLQTVNLGLSVQCAYRRKSRAVPRSRGTYAEDVARARSQPEIMTIARTGDKNALHIVAASVHRLRRQAVLSPLSFRLSKAPIRYPRRNSVLQSL